MKTYNVILKGIDVVEFSAKVGRNPQNLIRRLCKNSPTERLGYQKDGLMDVKKHKYVLFSVTESMAVVVSMRIRGT